LKREFENARKQKHDAEKAQRQGMQQPAPTPVATPEAASTPADATTPLPALTPRVSRHTPPPEVAEPLATAAEATAAPAVQGGGPAQETKPKHRGPAAIPGAEISPTPTPTATPEG
jgi:hypothetical protein